MASQTALIKNGQTIVCQPQSLRPLRACCRLAARPERTVKGVPSFCFALQRGEVAEMIPEREQVRSNLVEVTALSDGWVG